MKESMVFTRKYCTELTNLSLLSVFEVEIWCFRGPGDKPPLWIDRHDGVSPFSCKWNLTDDLDKSSFLRCVSSKRIFPC